jgi:hypothetical protein
MCVQIAEQFVEPPNDVDKETSITKFKNGKANAHDQIPARLIKWGEEEIKMVIYELISKIQEEEITPRVEIWHNMSNSSERGCDDV